MKIIILGASGMIGHKLTQWLEKEHEVVPVSRRLHPDLQSDCIFHSDLKVIQDAGDLSSYENLILKIRPDAVINCIGIIKQKKVAEDRRRQIYLNALFPHLLAEICDDAGCRLIHFSTDCVFSGLDGFYTEESVSDATDLYGKTKFLGEVDAPHCLTLRTSVIGHELSDNYSLIEWFLSHSPGSEVSGFTNAIYSGFPTVYLAEIIERILTDDPELGGIYHLSSNAISKFDLLTLVTDIYNVDINIKPNAEFVCDRSLNSDKLRVLLEYEPTDWRTMVESMYEDYLSTGYEALKKNHKINSQ